MATKQREVKQWITVNGVHVPVFEGESKADAAERVYRKTAGKHETKVRNMDDNWSQKLSRGEKAAMQMEVEKERRESGNPVKSTFGKTHSKLDQHSEIQKMAEEHVRKIWTKEGGVYNKELYDEADKFAEKHNLDKKKVRDAAFKAMNEKYADSLKRKKNGEDPVKFNESKGNNTQDWKNKSLSQEAQEFKSRFGKAYSNEDLQKEISRLDVLNKSDKATNGTKETQKALELELQERKAKGEIKENKEISKDQDLKEKQIAENKKQADAAKSNHEKYLEVKARLAERNALDEKKERAHSAAQEKETKKPKTDNQWREDELKSQIKQLEKNAFNKDARVVLGELRARVDEHRRFESGREDMDNRLKQLQAKEKQLTKTDAFNPEARQTLKELRGRIDEIRKILRNDRYEN